MAMLKYLLMVSLSIASLVSCKQVSKTPSVASAPVTSTPLNNAVNKQAGISYVHTTYEYVDPSGGSVLIKNSFPKGGNKVHNGKNHLYAVFWTRITNETANPLVLKINLPNDSFQLPSAPHVNLKLLFPVDTIEMDKLSLIDYGLDMQSVIEADGNKLSSLAKTVSPNTSIAFFVVITSHRGINGSLRTGLSLKQQELIYTVNGKEIPCGIINQDNLSVKQ